MHELEMFLALKPAVHKVVVLHGATRSEEMDGD